MSADADSILDHLRTVAAERRHRAGHPELAARVHALKALSAAAFRAQLRRPAGDDRATGRRPRFFLDELYGPHDFSERDAQFARIVPALVRLFPQEIVATVRHAGRAARACRRRWTAMAAGTCAERRASMRRRTCAAWQATGRARRPRAADRADARGRRIARPADAQPAAAPHAAHDARAGDGGRPGRAAALSRDRIRHVQGDAAARGEFLRPSARASGRWRARCSRRALQAGWTPRRHGVRTIP